MKINEEKCAGCGACEAEFPEIFKLEEGVWGAKANILKNIPLTKEIKEVCYFEAIEE